MSELPQNKEEVRKREKMSSGESVLHSMVGKIRITKKKNQTRKRAPSIEECLFSWDLTNCNPGS